MLTLLSGKTPIATLNVKGSYTNVNFVLTQSGNGIVVTETTPPAPPPGNIVWTGATDQDFNHLNWDINGQPAGRDPIATDDVAIIAGVTVNVEQQDTNHVDSLQIAAGSTLHLDAGLFIVDDAAMASVNNGEVDVDTQFLLSGTFINNGMLAIFSDGNLLTNDHTVTLGGTGTVSMTQGQIGGRTFSDTTPDDTLINTGDLIEGSGVIGLSGQNNALTFINDSTVDANDPAFPLTLQGGAVNQGTFEASNGGTLQLGGAIDNSSDVAGTGTGLIEALDGSTVQIGDTTSTGSTTLTGGALTQTGTGKIEISANTILDGSNKNGGSPGVTITGAVVVTKAPRSP